MRQIPFYLWQNSLKTKELLHWGYSNNPANVKKTLTNSIQGIWFQSDPLWAQIWHPYLLNKHKIVLRKCHLLAVQKRGNRLYVRLTALWQTLYRKTSSRNVRDVTKLGQIGTNLGLFKISFSTFCSSSTRFVSFGANLTQFWNTADISEQ